MLGVGAQHARPARGPELRQAAADVVVRDPAALEVDGVGDASEEAAQSELGGARKRRDEEAEAVQGDTKG